MGTDQTIYKLKEPIDKMSEICGYQNDKWICLYSATKPYDCEMFLVMTPVLDDGEHGYPKGQLCWSGMDCKIVTEEEFKKYFEEII